MAYSDFDLTYFNYSGTPIANADQGGDAITNASLSNPLTTAGDYCRRFFTTGNYSNNHNTLKFSANSSVLGGTLVSPAADTAISLRIWARLNAANFPSGGVKQLYAGVNAFSPITGLDVYGGGWELVLRVSRNNTDSAVVDLVLRGGRGARANTGSVASLTYNVLATCESGLSLNTWYNIRMDIIPNSISQKTINCYRHDGTDWNLLTSLVRTNSDSDWPTDLVTYNRCGFSTLFATSTSMSGTFNVSSFVDGFQASTETVP